MKIIKSEEELQKVVMEKAGKYVASLNGKFNHVVSEQFLATTLACYHLLMMDAGFGDIQTTAGDAAGTVFQATLQTACKQDINGMKLRNQYVIQFLDIEYETETSEKGSD
jgi:hypothetical protein